MISVKISDLTRLGFIKVGGCWKKYLVKINDKEKVTAYYHPTIDHFDINIQLSMSPEKALSEVNSVLSMFSDGTPFGKKGLK